MIKTPRLNLVPVTVEMLQSILNGSEDFLNKFGIVLPSPYTEFPESLEYTIKYLQETAIKPPLQSYAIITQESPTYIGQTGFVSPPDENGVTEFGYEIALQYRGKGYADEAIKGMINTAFAQPAVKAILANTLNEKNASNHLLIKNNFVFEKAVTGTEEGTVWQWKLHKKTFEIKQMFS